MITSTLSEIESRILSTESDVVIIDAKKLDTSTEYQRSSREGIKKGDLNVLFADTYFVSNLIKAKDRRIICILNRKMATNEINEQLRKAQMKALNS